MKFFSPANDVSFPYFSFTNDEIGARHVFVPSKNKEEDV